MAPRWVPGGLIGVDVFFVISGFLITGIILRDLRAGTFSIARFYRHRIRRIFPALSVVLLATLIAGWQILGPAELRALGAGVAAGAGFASNLLLWKQTSYFAAEAVTNPLLHLWSLGVEEQYYLVWPPILMVTWRWRHSVVAFAMLSVASFALNVVLVHEGHGTAAFYSPLSRLWELLTGGMLAQLAIAQATEMEAPGRWLINAIAGTPARRAWLLNCTACVGVLLLIATVLLMPAEAAFPGWWALLPVLATVLLIAAGPRSWVNRALLGNPLAIGVGLISYPLYLWHWPLLAFMRLRTTHGPDGTAAERVGVVVVTFMLAWATYRLIETPIRRSSRWRPIVALSALQLLILGLGLGSYHFLDRFPERFNPTVRALFAAEHPASALFRDGYREATCLLAPEQDDRAFAPSCTAGLDGDAASRDVLVWGDSYAAHLLPGLVAALPPSLHLDQLTASRCPPIVGHAETLRPHCTGINDFISARLAVRHPRIVILAARWNVYADYWRVEATVAALKRAGVPHVLLVGASAQFDAPVPRLLRQWVLRQPLRDATIPQRLPTAKLAKLRTIDSTLHAIAGRAGADFVSPLTTQCHARECLVAGDRDVGALYYWDEGHYTLAGSRFVAERVMAPYLRSIDDRRDDRPAHLPARLPP